MAKEAEPFLKKIKSEYIRNFSQSGWNRAMKKLHVTEKQWLDMIRRRMSIEKFTSEYIYQGLTVSRKECKEYYNSHLDDYMIREKYDIQQVFAIEQNKQAVDMAAELLKDGKSFDEVARWFWEQSENRRERENRGMIRDMEVGVMPDSWENAVRKLKKGEISPVIKTQYGYHIIRLLDRTASREESFDQAQPAIARKLLAEKRETAMAIWFTKYDSSRLKVFDADFLQLPRYDREPVGKTVRDPASQNQESNQ